MHILIQGKEYPIIICKKRNKNAYIRILEDDSIYVTVPYFYTEKKAMDLVLANQKSIEKMILKKHAKTLEGFWYLGSPYQVIYTPLYEVEFYHDKVYAKDRTTLEKFLKKEREKIFLDRLEYWYQTIDEKVPYPTLRIRKMKTRWGVCNRKNNTITLNADLLKYSIDKLDYVIIHELAHFTHFNHSPLFWKLVEKYEPNYKKIRKELR